MLRDPDARLGSDGVYHAGEGTRHDSGQGRFCRRWIPSAEPALFGSHGIVKGFASMIRKFYFMRVP